MTLEQADKMADIILNAPTVFSSYPKMFINASGIGHDSFAYSESLVSSAAWMKGLPNLDYIGYLTDNGVYSCRNGFQIGYEREIKNWDITNDFDLIRNVEGRYITLEDLKMMAYVGIENYRAKVMGHRWRFNEKGVNTVNDTSSYHRGAIIRQDDGKRWIKCSRNNNVMPIPGVTVNGWTGIKNPYYWVPFTRRPAFGEPKAEHVPLLENVIFPFEKTTRFVKAATIEGQGDLVALRNVFDPPGVDEAHSNASMLVPNYALNYEGKMVVRISEVDGLEKEDDKTIVDSSSIVWCISNSYKYYRIWFKNQDGITVPEISKEEYKNAGRDPSFVRQSVSYSQSFKTSFVPLAKGKTYYIYIERTDSRVGGGIGISSPPPKGGYLVVVRVPLKTLAPKF